MKRPSPRIVGWRLDGLAWLLTRSCFSTMFCKLAARRLARAVEEAS